MDLSCDTRSICWVAVMAIFPQVALCSAANQFQLARYLRRHWNKFWPDNAKEKDWLGMTGVFFVVMGGLYNHQHPPRNDC